jgi:ribosomal protein S18 acetylase RimI-like enzyme
MASFLKTANAILRRVQNMALYRRLGRQIISGIILREATEIDQIAVRRWLNSNDTYAQGVRHNPNATDWIAEVHGQLAGFVQLVRYSPENAPYTGYWLFSLYTKSRWQGLGIGEALSQVVIERARMEGAPALDLVVYEDNFRAIRLYRKLGFEIYTISELEPQLESERALTGRRRVVMRKLLSN